MCPSLSFVSKKEFWEKRDRSSKHFFGFHFFAHASISMCDSKTKIEAKQEPVGQARTWLLLDITGSNLYEWSPCRKHDVAVLYHGSSFRDAQRKLAAVREEKMAIMKKDLSITNVTPIHKDAFLYTKEPDEDEEDDEQQDHSVQILEI